ncbi:hypothetical protein LTR22_021059 [Elasticomyces elasticus]|nr:hypothetical protein LTR22_021059 [Elasticomyces elasticus]KAK4922579.1 hypothetical protein LTR49_010106 [Elasticomyces elasticus]
MLNARALSELLTKNSDERLCKRWLLMTPNGTLLAHTQPIDTRDLRQQVAMIAMSWQEQEQVKPEDTSGANRQPGESRELQTLVLESIQSNILVRRIQPRLLLVLEGGVPPRKQSFEPRVFAEDGNGEPLHYNKTAESSLATSPSSMAGSSTSTAKSGVLELHNKKLDAMATAIATEFEQTGFKMPEDGGNNQLF